MPRSRCVRAVARPPSAAVGIREQDVADAWTQAREQLRIRFPSFDRSWHRLQNPTNAAANLGRVRQFVAASQNSFCGTMRHNQRVQGFAFNQALGSTVLRPSRISKYSCGAAPAPSLKAAITSPGATQSPTDL